MAVMKQKSIKPARDIPYSGGILMFNPLGTAVAANTLVRAGGVQGGGMSMISGAANVRADNANNGGAVPLFVTKHGIPAGRWGVVLPWKIVTNVDNNALGAAGTTLYLSDAGVLANSAGTVNRPVGVVLVRSGGAGATDGTTLLYPR